MKKKSKQTQYAKHYVPPRSMTEEEKKYYDRNKTLQGFRAGNKQGRK